MKDGKPAKDTFPFEFFGSGPVQLLCGPAQLLRQVEGGSKSSACCSSFALLVHCCDVGQRDIERSGETQTGEMSIDSSAAKYAMAKIYHDLS